MAPSLTLRVSLITQELGLRGVLHPSRIHKPIWMTISRWLWAPNSSHSTITLCLMEVSCLKLSIHRLKLLADLNYRQLHKQPNLETSQHLSLSLNKWATSTNSDISSIMVSTCCVWSIMLILCCRPWTQQPVPPVTILSQLSHNPRRERISRVNEAINENAATDFKCDSVESNNPAHLLLACQDRSE